MTAEAFQLGDGRLVVVDRDVDVVVLPVVAGAFADDEEGGALFAAPVAPGRTAREEGRHEPVGERALGGLERRRHRLDGLLGDEDVALRGVAVPGHERARLGRELLLGAFDSRTLGSQLFGARLFNVPHSFDL